MGCNPEVQAVTQRTWHDDEHAEQRPPSAETARDPKRGFAVRPDVSAFYQHHTLVGRWIDAVLLEQTLADRRLQGGEAEMDIPVTTQDELHGADTKITHPVEQDDARIRLLSLALDRSHSRTELAESQRREEPPGVYFANIYTCLRTGSVIGIRIPIESSIARTSATVGAPGGGVTRWW